MDLYDKIFMQNLTGKNCSSLLDIGCGTGIYFKILSRYADKIHAIDTSVDMVVIADDFCQQSNIGNVFPQVGSALNIPFSDNSFEVVVSLDVLHHVNEPQRVIEEVYRVLKPGGFFLVFEPNILNPLMFAVHLIPPEERLALKLSRPNKLGELLRGKFTLVQWTGICELITQVKGVKSWIINTYLNFWKLLGRNKLFPRQTWLVRKCE